jgi:hypothetical protein
MSGELESARSEISTIGQFHCAIVDSCFAGYCSELPAGISHKVCSGSWGGRIAFQPMGSFRVCQKAAGPHGIECYLRITDELDCSFALRGRKYSTSLSAKFSLWGHLTAFANVLNLEFLKICNILGMNCTELFQNSGETVDIHGMVRIMTFSNSRVDSMTIGYSQCENREIFSILISMTIKPWRYTTGVHLSQVKSDIICVGTANGASFLGH